MASNQFLDQADTYLVKTTMRLGLLADIHEEVELLRRAVDALTSQGVSQFVVLGDIFDTGKSIDATVAALSQLNSVGVWGNHDFGLCRDVSEETRRRYSPEVLDYFARLEPWIELGASRFQHIEPFLDSEQLEDLWSYGGDSCLDPALSFKACRHSRIFMGHLHRWSLMTPRSVVSWSEREPLRMAPDERYLVVVHAVQQGWCAWYDYEEDVLCRIQVA